MASQSSVTSEAELSASPQNVSRVLLLLTFLGCSAIAAVVSLQFFPVFQTPAELMIPSPPDEIAVAREASMWNCRLANSQLLVTGLVAAIAGGLWAAIGASQTRSGANPGVSFVLGAIAASAVSAVALLAGHFIIEFRVDPDYEMHRSVIMQVALMSILGIGMGAALGIGTRKSAMQYAMNGFVSGVVAAVLYVVLTSVVMTNAQTDILVPGGTLNGSKDISILAAWLGVMGLAFSLIIPKLPRKPAAAKIADA